MPKKDAIEDVYPLTPLQEGLLFHSIYTREGGLYHDQFSAVLRGPLDPDALAEAWRDVVAATPVLRTAFAWKGGGAPRQVVARRVEAVPEREDWRSFPPAEQARRRAALLESDLARGFDLARPPLTRVTLARLADDAWLLLWSRHHLLLDGWSVTLVLRSWLAAYGARVRGEASAVAAARPFRDYVDWLAGREGGAAEAYWRGVLGDVEQATPLGLARPEGREAPPAQARYGEAELELGLAESDALRALAAAAGVTPATVLQGAWALLLARFSGERDVVFGQTVAGRPPELAGVETMVGLFINTLPRRVRIRSAASAGEWLRAIQAESAAAREFEHTPLVRAQGWSGVARDRPLFETLLVIENYPFEQALGALGAVRVEGARSHERAHYPVTLVAAPGGRWQLRFLYDRARLTDRQAEQWRSGFAAVLAGLARGADGRVGAVGALGADEAGRILGEWNATDRAHDRSASLVSLVRDQAARAPEATAVSDGRRSLSYRELLARGRGLARRLRAAGVRPEDRVGVCLGRSVDLVASLIGILEAGAAYVPLDPAYPEERLAFMAADAGLAALVTAPEFAGRVPAGAAAVLQPDGTGEGAEPGPPPAPAQLAYLIYTSGSTGRPKAAAIEHRQAVALVHWALGAFSPAELAGMFFSTSVCFDLSVFEVFVTLAAGGRVIVGENALELATHPDRDAVTFVNTVPSAAAELARQGAFPPGVGTICLAGEPLTAALADRLYGFPQLRRVCDLYGPSEDTTYSTYAQRERGGPATIGRVLANSRLYLLDGDLQPAPAGAVGEIHLAGEGLARGYFARPDLTAERFIPDPFSPVPGGRLYRTGDLARFREDGSLEFLGRKDHQVKLRGYRIELGEIQARLEHHSEVAEAAVLVREHPARGKYIAAFVAARDGAAPGAERLADWIRQALPVYMMPSAWHFLARLPRTPNGKLDRRALPEDAAAAPPAAAGPAPRPADPVEEIAAGVWAEVLGLGAVRPADNFFELGGHSLLATQAIARLRPALQTEVPLRMLFEHPTLGAFAAAVRRQRLGAGESPPIPARPAGTPPPLSFGQERMWAMERLSPGSSAYHLPSVLEASGPIDAGRLRRALESVVARHEALRTRFPERGGLAAAEVDESPQVDFLEAAAADAAAARRLAAAEAAAPFDLARGPLLRARLIRLGPERHWLQLTAHHIATDGWSEWILVRELAAFYAGRAPEDAPVRYGDFALWQRRRLAGGELASQVGWWKGELAGIEALELPLDRRRPSDPTGRGGRVQARIGEIETERLRAAARAQHGTLFMALLAAWEIWLWRHSGQTDFGVGVPVAGRTRPELEAVIGLFVNTVVLRSDADGTGSYAELIGRVRERALRAFDRQEAPFAQVVEAAQPPREPGRAPLFQVMFNLQNAPRAELDLGPVELRPVEMETATAKAELSLNAVERADGTVDLSLEFSRDLFGPASAERFLARFGELVRAAAAEP
ncbi:MAG TPA: amino acid adenylation domain-containing protein, partial [Opitutaceae bacterium]|nr:amino acid adenylation domain-containing protein [Opitutaceae bacterium]